MLNDTLIYCQKLKENINLLIQNNKLIQAKDLLNQYEKIVQNDIDIYSIKSVIAMLEGDITAAEELLKEGLAMDENNMDLLYNIVFLYEQQEKYITAYHYIKKIEMITPIDMQEEIDKKRKEIEKVPFVNQWFIYPNDDTALIKIKVLMKNQLEELRTNSLK